MMQPHRMGVLDEVRAHAAAVAARASFVAIRQDALQPYARSLPIHQARGPELDAVNHYVGPHAPTLAYFVTLDAINFGSGFFPRLRKRPGLSGYFTIAASLKDRFEACGPWSAEQLVELDSATCADVFGQSDLGDPSVTQLMDLFARSLNDLGSYLLECFGGSFQALVDAAASSAERLVSLLAVMPMYRDVGFYKRAQLTAADLALAGVASFTDLDKLTMFADNLVPHVLRMDGVLEYTPELLERINREEFDQILSGSREEREIRACALHAVELLRTWCPDVTSMQLDYVLWNRGQHPTYKAQPRHRTRSVFY